MAFRSAFSCSIASRLDTVVLSASASCCCSFSFSSSARAERPSARSAAVSVVRRLLRSTTRSEYPSSTCSSSLSTSACRSALPFWADVRPTAFRIMYSRTSAPNAQQIVSRNDMLKMSNFLRAMFRQHAYEFEHDPRRAKTQHVPDAQGDVSCDALVIDERPVSAVILHDGLAVFLHQSAM